MGSMTERLWRGANTAAVWLYRRTGGKVGGSARGCPVLLLTAPGRTSGRPRTVPVGYVFHEGAYLLAASAGGRPREPQWIRNLRATDAAKVEVGRDAHPVSVEVLQGEARNSAWRDVILATHPFFAEYEKKSGRRIAVARLTPTG